jgi:hypothetical protein
MTNEERIHELEDAVILLTNVIEEKTGPFVWDMNPSVSGSGALIFTCGWRRSKRAGQMSRRSYATRPWWCRLSRSVVPPKKPIVSLSALA